MKKYTGDFIRAGATLLAAIIVVSVSVITCSLEQYHIKQEKQVCHQLKSLNSKIEGLTSLIEKSNDT